MLSQVILSICLHFVVSADIQTNVDNSAQDIDEFVPFLAKPVNDEIDWRLLQKFVSTNNQRNVIISPFSLKLVLAILYEGASGLTEKEFQKVFKFPEDKSKLRQNFSSLLDTLVVNRHNYIINIGTQLFLDNRLTPLQSYQAKLQHHYHTDIVSTNFSNPSEASNGINSWVEYLTNGRIKTLTSPEDVRNTVLLAANAIYFKGMWSYPFPRNQTFNDNFYISSNEVIPVSYMNQTDLFYYCDSKTLGAQILRLPYKGRKFGFYIILPYNKDGIARFTETMNLREFTLAILLMDLKKVNVIMPKFGFDFQAKYSEILREFGFDTLFGGISSFPGIVRDQQAQLVVSNILQKSGLDINEEGSIIYSATQVTLTNKFGREPTITFNATHPFLFYIQEQSTGNLLFMGKVENPNPEELPTRFGTLALDNIRPAPTKTTQIPFIPAANNPSVAPATLGSRFDIELLKSSLGSSKNVLLSPSSIKVSLAMLAEAAVSSAASQIYRVLGISEYQRNEPLQNLVRELSESQPHSVLEFQNALFVSNNHRIKDEYKTKVEQRYKALVSQLNFHNSEEAAAYINRFVKEATNGFIPSVLSPRDINYQTQVMLANVLYFKADWNKTFEKSLTKTSCFNTARKGCTDINFMNIIDFFDFGETANTYFIKLQYTGNRRAMLLLIPKQIDGLSLALSDLEQRGFEDILTILNYTEVELLLPKFEISYGHDIVDILKKMGIRQIFESNSSLSNLLEGKTASVVDSLVHKAKIEVTEEGTEASALSLVSVVPLMGTTTPKIKADRPFAFIIYNTKTNNILFEGVLNEPDTNIDADAKTANMYTYSPFQTSVRNNFPPQQDQQRLSQPSEYGF